MIERIEKEEKENTQSSQVLVRQLKDEIKDIDIKLSKLLDLHLDGGISRKLFLKKKADLLSARKTLEEQVIDFNSEQIQKERFEQFKDFILLAKQAKTIVQNGDSQEMISWFKKSDSNLKIFNQKIRLKKLKEKLIAI